MKLLKVSIILLILVLLLSGILTTGLRHIRAAEPRAGATSTVHIVGPLHPPDGTDATEWLSFRAFSVSSMAQSSTGIWHIETVDSKKGLDSSLVLDGLGRPHIGYIYQAEFDNLDLRYAWHDGTSWHVETVDSEGWSEYASLALDGSDRPHISYYDYGNLGYTWHDGASWHIETVDNKGGYYTSLALDSAGRPHISYQGNFGDLPNVNWDLKYAWHNGARWYIETVDGVSEVGFNTSLALDGFDRPHISYLDDALGDLKYAWHDGVNWHIETVDSEGGSDTSLALDGMGQPHISYFENDSSGDLKYAWRDGVNWHIETVDSNGGYDCSLALDNLDYPHISYYSANALEYAWYDGVNWHVETVDSPGAGSNTSLALDESGWPHISYEGGDLRYAYLTPFPLLSLGKQVMPSESLYDNDILTYTLTFSGSDLSVRLWDPLPDTVHYIPGSITGNVTPMAVYDPTAHAITWEGTLSVDTVRKVRFQVTPDITVTKSLAAPLPIANTVWLTDTDNDRSITATATSTLLPVPLSLGKRATPDDRVRNGDILTYTLTLYGPGLSAHLWDSLPNGVHYIPGSMTGTIVPAASYSSTANAVVWEGTLSTDTTQTIHFQVTPGITGSGSLSLSLPIVNTAWLTATESARIVSATAIVNGERVYLPVVVRNY